jgi:hypothetical protein
VILELERIPELPAALSGFKASDGSIWQLVSAKRLP